MRRRALAVLALAALPASAAELRSSLELGVDSFAQRFRLTDVSLAANIDAADLLTQTSLRDTTEVFSEYRALIEIGLLDQRDDGRIDLRARGSLGSERLLSSAILEARLGSRDSKRRLDVGAEVEARRFRSDSDFALQSDGFRSKVRIHGSRRVSDSFRPGLRLRASQEEFEDPSEFELDDRHLDLSATAEFERGFSLFGQLEAGGGWRDVPDSSQISHRRAFVLGDLSWFGAAWSLLMRAGLEHREYEDPDVRSPYWNLVLEPTLARQLDESWRLALRSAHEFLDYERDSSIYFDSGVGRVGLELEFRSLRWSLACQPRWGWLDAPTDVEDRYVQPGTLLRFDWLGTGRLWLSLSEEVGYRDYASVGEEFPLYSDYWFARTTLLASLRLSSRFTLDCFLSDEPEAHRNEADDGRLTLFSASLRATL